MLYLESMYVSWRGGDHHSIAVISHNSSVNRRDQPAGIDEKQHIDIEMEVEMVHEKQEIVLPGSDNLAGNFRLSLGGKHSRDIDANASAAAVAAAVRELISNCAGDIGLESDASGNTFECFQGRGQTYRGLVSTTIHGIKCRNWVETQYWDPHLAVIAGLDANLCRNPDYRSDG
jgi:hypothetical protein